MEGERTLLVDGPAIVAARKKKGFLSRAAFSRRLEKSGISKDTLDRCEKSPAVPHRAYLSTLEIIARELSAPVESFVIDEGVTSSFRTKTFRNCSGVWEVSGRDIVVPAHFEYPNGEKTINGRVIIRANSQDASITAEGADHDDDPLSFYGAAREDGNFIVGQYAVENVRLHVYGVLALQYHSCGRKMSGFYLGRETGQGSTFILGDLSLHLLEDLSSE